MKKIFLVLILALCAVAVGSALVYKKSATASFYADAFQGKTTSNGEKFNMNDFTCAHKMLPFGTVLKVTNLANGKSVKVRVNDRGPFVKTREIDLSKAAAKKIDMIGAGTATVKLEVVSLGKYDNTSRITGKKACEKAGITYYEISMNSKDDSEIDSQTDADSNSDQLSEKEKRIEQIKNVKRPQNKDWDIQIGSFNSKSNAIDFAKKAKRAGISGVVLHVYENYTKVVVKAVKTRNLNSVIDTLTSKGYWDLVVKERE